MKVRQYDSKYELPEKQKEMLRKIVSEKTGLKEREIAFGTSGKAQLVFSETELWIMMEGTISKDRGTIKNNTLYGDSYLSGLKNNTKWLAKVYILFKLSGPNVNLQSRLRSYRDLGLHHGKNNDMENFLKEITYKTHRMFDDSDDIDVDLRGFVLPNSDIIFFLLLWRKSVVGRFRK